MPAVIQKQHPTIFLCEAEHGPTRPLAQYLAARNFNVHSTPDSRQAIDQIITQAPDLVLLDAGLPDNGGYEVCHSIRPFYNGIILFLGWDTDETAQLLAFEWGADDYILMPVSPTLLTARIKAHLKRYGTGTGQPNNVHHIQVGQLVVDAQRREVLLAGQPVDLTSIQFEVLFYLAKRSGRVVTREELYSAIYNVQYNGFDRSVDVYVSRIRQQLGDSVNNPNYLKTVRGVGYLFVSHAGQQS